MILPQWPRQELAICELGDMAGSEECNEKANYPSLVGSYSALRYKQITSDFPQMNSGKAEDH